MDTEFISKIFIDDTKKADLEVQDPLKQYYTLNGFVNALTTLLRLGKACGLVIYFHP